MTKKPFSSTTLSRRQVLTGAIGTGAALSASALVSTHLAAAQAHTTTVFTHTTVVTNDAQRTSLLDVALAVQGDTVVAIGETTSVLQQFPQAQLIDGKGKAILPGLINCHAHLDATLARGFNEDFGFPNSARIPVRPSSLLSKEETTLMAVVGALEAIRCGTTTLVENVSNIADDADALASSGLRWVFAESIRDSENVAGPMSHANFPKAVAPVFSARLLDEGMQRIDDLYSAWHGKNNGRISVFPAAALPETSSPTLLRRVREFAEKHDLGYTIHLTQSQPEVDFMMKFHGMRPATYLDRHGFLGPRLFAAHCRYVDEEEIRLLGNAGATITHQAAMAANRGVSPPIPALREAGCTIANGTDNNNNDMLKVMRVAMLTERIKRNDEIPGLLPQPEDIFDDTVRGGARAVNQEARLGSLEIGKKADLIVLDTQKAHLVPSGRILSAWLHNGQPSDVESVMVDGEFIMRDRKVLTMDEESIIAEANKVGQRIWGTVLEDGPIVLPRL
jgi:5-methylthioadenosine/S-adenosylhomocysteine deaminase